MILTGKRWATRTQLIDETLSAGRPAPGRRHPVARRTNRIHFTLEGFAAVTHQANRAGVPERIFFRSVSRKLAITYSDECRLG